MLPTWVSNAAKGQGGPRKSLPLIVVVITLVILWRQFSHLGSRIASLEHGHSRLEAALAHLSNSTALEIARLEKANINSTTVLEAQIQDVLQQVQKLSKTQAGLHASALEEGLAKLTASLASVKSSLDSSDTKLTTDVTALSEKASQFSENQKEILELYAQVRKSTDSLDASDANMTAHLTALTIQATAFSEKHNQALDSHAQAESKTEGHAKTLQLLTEQLQLHQNITQAALELQQAAVTQSLEAHDKLQVSINSISDNGAANTEAIAKSAEARRSRKAAKHAKSSTTASADITASAVADAAAQALTHAAADVMHVGEADIKGEVALKDTAADDAAAVQDPASLTAGSSAVEAATALPASSSTDQDGALKQEGGAALTEGAASEVVGSAASEGGGSGQVALVEGVAVDGAVRVGSDAAPHSASTHEEAAVAVAGNVPGVHTKAEEGHTNALVQQEQPLPGSAAQHSDSSQPTVDLNQASAASNDQASVTESAAVSAPKRKRKKRKAAADENDLSSGTADSQQEG